MGLTTRLRVTGSFLLSLVMLMIGAVPFYAEGSPEQGGVEERGVPQFPGRPLVVPPPVTAPAPAASYQVMTAYRAALNQPAARGATEAEIRRQLRTVPPIAFVNGYWITPVDISTVYSQIAVRTSLLGSLRGIPGGAQALDTLVTGRTDLALVFTPNQWADTFQIPRGDFMQMIGLNALRGKATDSWMNPQPGGVNVFAAWGYIKEAFDWIAAWYQNHKAHGAENDQKKNCEDKGPSGDCDGDGVKNADDECPYDPECKEDKSKFVGCMVVTCQTFTTEFGGEFDGIIQQIANQIRQSIQMGQIVTVGQVGMGHVPIGVVFPPGIR